MNRSNTWPLYIGVNMPYYQWQWIFFFKRREKIKLFKLHIATPHKKICNNDKTYKRLHILYKWCIYLLTATPVCAGTYCLNAKICGNEFHCILIGFITSVKNWYYFFWEKQDPAGIYRYNLMKHLHPAIPKKFFLNNEIWFNIVNQYVPVYYNLLVMIINKPNWLYAYKKAQAKN